MTNLHFRALNVKNIQFKCVWKIAEGLLLLIGIPQSIWSLNILSEVTSENGTRLHTVFVSRDGKSFRQIINHPYFLIIVETMKNLHGRKEMRTSCFDETVTDFDFVANPDSASNLEDLNLENALDHPKWFMCVLLFNYFPRMLFSCSEVKRAECGTCTIISEDPDQRIKNTDLSFFFMESIFASFCTKVAKECFENGKRDMNINVYSTILNEVKVYLDCFLPSCLSMREHLEPIETMKLRFIKSERVRRMLKTVLEERIEKLIAVKKLKHSSCSIRHKYLRKSKFYMKYLKLSKQINKFARWGYTFFKRSRSVGTEAFKYFSIESVIKTSRKLQEKCNLLKKQIERATMTKANSKMLKYIDYYTTVLSSVSSIYFHLQVYFRDDILTKCWNDFFMIIKNVNLQMKEMLWVQNFFGSLYLWDTARIIQANSNASKIICDNVIPFFNFGFLQNHGYFCMFPGFIKSICDRWPNLGNVVGECMPRLKDAIEMIERAGLANFQTMHWINLYRAVRREDTTIEEINEWIRVLLKQIKEKHIKKRSDLYIRDVDKGALLKMYVVLILRYSRFIYEQPCHREDFSMKFRSTLKFEYHLSEHLAAV